MNPAIIVKRLCVTLAALSLAAGAGAQTYTVLKHFNPNINASGYQARGTLAQGPDGTLYGVATLGGAGAAGVVFRIQTNGTGFTVIKNFPLTDVTTGTNSDGANPQAGLLLSGGTLYGTAANGGASGNGTVFSLSTNGTGFTVLKNFTVLDLAGTNGDGANPAASLVLSGSVLYGTTQYGGTAAAGTIFLVNTNGTGFTNLYSLNPTADGANPAARLVLSGGTLYGTAANGGDSDAGTVFSVSTNGTGFNRLHSFSGSGTDGANPIAGLVVSGGLLYGTTQHGDSGDSSDDGTVFRLSINGSSFTNLYSFTGNDGFSPDAELLLAGGTLYGTTANGGFQGIPIFYGTVFKINPDGTGFATVRSLTGNEGWGPQGGLVLSGSTLYGTTVNGGLLPTVFAYAHGTVFSVDISGSGLADLCVFTEFSGAADPWTGLTLAGNTLYGTTLYGGTNNNGTLFELNTNGSGYAEIKDFSATDSNGDNSDGANPRAPLVLSGSTFYGTTHYGGTAGQGAIFRITAGGGGFTNLYSFNDVHPDLPIAALVVSGSTLYGMTPIGGSAGLGSVFRINTDGGGFTNLYSFSGSDGSLPTAGLVLSGSTLYGATQVGGAGQGNLFQVNTDGTHFTNIYNFTPTVFDNVTHANTNSDGVNPGNVLLLSNNTLYGTAYHGGSAGQGTVFKINTDRSGFTVLQNFAGTNSGGAGPDDLLLSGGTLYGMTQNGGTSDKGTVFKLDTAGSGFTVLKSFSGGSDGANPIAGLVFSGNTLYGTTVYGGLSGHGTVFSLALASVVPIPLNIRSIGNAVVLTWSDPAFSLQTAPIVNGIYTNLPASATSPYTNVFNDPIRFFRLQAN